MNLIKPNSVSQSGEQFVIATGRPWGYRKRKPLVNKKNSRRTKSMICYCGSVGATRKDNMLNAYC